VDPVPDPLLVKKSGSSGSSGSIAGKSSYCTTEAGMNNLIPLKSLTANVSYEDKCNKTNVVKNERQGTVGQHMAGQ
jgi:hypothetical protein